MIITKHSLSIYSVLFKQPYSKVTKLLCNPKRIK